MYRKANPIKQDLDPATGTVIYTSLYLKVSCRSSRKKTTTYYAVYELFC